MTSNKTDHDLLTTLAADVKWLKLIMALYLVPGLLSVLKTISTWSSG